MNVWIQTPFDNLPCEGFRKQRYWLMAQAFVAAGHAVTYFTTDFNHGTKRCRAAVSGMMDGIDVRLIPTPRYSKNVSLGRIYSHVVYARRLERAMAALPPPEVVISASPTLGAAMSAMRSARRTGAKFVLDVQDAWPETFYRLLPRGFSWLGKILLFGMHRTARRLYREADRVTGVCERYRAIVGRQDYQVSYLGIEVQGACACPAERRRGAIVYAGNLGEGYDLETVVDAVERDSRLSLDVAGSGPREPELRRRAARLVGEGRVRFHGYLSETALRSLLSDCSVGVIPMRDDSWVGIPNKLFDYLAAGLPVVTTLHGECGALVEESRVGLTCDFGNVDSMLAALQKVIDGDFIGKVKLPSRLAATEIYPEYVRNVEHLRSK